MRLPHLITDGMVIQRNATVPIWGWADPGTEVQVMFRDQLHTDTASDEGKWRVVLPEMHAGGPFEMLIVADDQPVTITDILIGDVWIASGQSNMEWSVRYSGNPETEIAAANDSEIRHFKVPRSWSWSPEDSLAGGSWYRAEPEHVGDFSAVGYYFARELRKHVDVPIGILNTSWGGSRIEPWMSASTLGMSRAEVDSIRIGAENWEEMLREAVRTRIGVPATQDQGYVEGKPVWSDPDLDDSDWDTLAAIGLWENQGYAGVDGVCWYRKVFELSEEEVAGGIRLGLAMIDDSDVTWVNGVQVGGMEQAWNVPREYKVDASVLRPGRNVVVIRVEDTGGGGGLYGDPSQLFLESSLGVRPLDGPWLFNVGVVEVYVDGFMNLVPTVLYNKMIRPLLDFPIAGALWYQGESNAGPEDAFEYRILFQEMISQWRNDWGVGDFPFLFVQLANYMEVYDHPSESDWALLRESQSEALSLPNVGQAVIIDIGEADNIHPKNKQDVGLRLSLAARKLAYGEDIVHSGPTLSEFEVRDGKVYLKFKHIGDELVLRELPSGVSGFAVAGADQRFVWADVKIENDRLVVWSDGVSAPVAVRYAWSDNPAGANLYNSAGLPASPFRTDSW